ncbi:MAG: hypothetical protein HGA66_18300 [Holophaga sp.]|nr:hypothetical protein [Holophaga sp.]
MAWKCPAAAADSYALGGDPAQAANARERSRARLASGTLELLAYVGEARLGAYERFRTAAAAMPLAAFKAALREGLGLPGEGNP